MRFIFQKRYEIIKELVEVVNNFDNKKGEKERSPGRKSEFSRKRTHMRYWTP
jgi:hypothetical protein